jgi:hypothetical protein
MDIFSSASISHKSVLKKKIRVRWLVGDWGIQIIFIAIFLVLFGVHMNFSFSIGVKNLFPINLGSPVIMLIIEPKIVKKNWTCSSIFIDDFDDGFRS